MTDPRMQLALLEEFEMMAKRREGLFAERKPGNEPMTRGRAENAFEALFEGRLRGAIARQALVSAWNAFYRENPEFAPPKEPKRYRQDFRRGFRAE